MSSGHSTYFEVILTDHIQDNLGIKKSNDASNNARHGGLHL
jgi:hypothetical protein